jgi:malate/lactate dehydrogenase
MRHLAGDWLGRAWMLRLRSVEQVFRVDTAVVHAMATRWSASVADLDEIVAPSGLGLSCQTSAAAVDAAHADVVAFTAGLATRVGERATGVAQDATSYIAQEAASTAAVATVFQPAISE